MATAAADLLVKAGDTPGAPFYYYPNRGGSAWELASRIDFNFNPPFTFEDANVQLVDLDNDKRVDVLRTTDSAYYVYFNQGSTWSGGPDRVLDPLAFGAVLLFDDPRVHLADMNGDRLQDMVFVMDGQAIYFPSRGLGDFDEVVLMAAARTYTAARARPCWPTSTVMAWPICCWSIASTCASG